MTEEEQKKWREERDARGLARKHERQEARARMEKVSTQGADLYLSNALHGKRAGCCVPAQDAFAGRNMRLPSCSHQLSLAYRSSPLRFLRRLPPPHIQAQPPASDNHHLPPHLSPSLQALDIGQKIVIDLDFADLMTDTELRSICQQLGYCWHINCAAKHPAHLALTSLQGKMREVMGRQISGYLNWQATTTEKVGGGRGLLCGCGCHPQFLDRKVQRMRHVQQRRALLPGMAGGQLAGRPPGWWAGCELVPRPASHHLPIPCCSHT